MLWRLSSAAPYLEHLTLRNFWSVARDRFPTLRNLLPLEFCDSMLERPSVLHSLGCERLQRFTHGSTGFVVTSESDIGPGADPEDAEFEQDEETGEPIVSENAHAFINHLRPCRFSLKHIDLAMRLVKPGSRIASLKEFEACETLSLSSKMIQPLTIEGAFVDFLPQSIRKFKLRGMSGFSPPGSVGHLIPLARYPQGLPNLESATFYSAAHRSFDSHPSLWVGVTVTFQPKENIVSSDPEIFNQHIEQSSITEAGKTYLREELMPLLIAFQAEQMSVLLWYKETGHDSEFVDLENQLTIAF